MAARAQVMSTTSTALPPIAGIEAALKSLGNPRVIWFRGHAAGHLLLPSLFRFPEGVANERRMIDAFRENPAVTGVRVRVIDALVSLHHSYVPTRLLAWTDRADVALFCALVRESQESALFILDPVALNAESRLAGLLTLHPEDPAARAVLDRAEALAWMQRPIAVAHPEGGPHPTADSNFTLHGTDTRSLDAQCPACVRKVVLTIREKSIAAEYVLARTLE